MAFGHTGHAYRVSDFRGEFQRRKAGAIERYVLVRRFVKSAFFESLKSVNAPQNQYLDGQRLQNKLINFDGENKSFH